jgi:hypothetical protein
VWFTVQSYDIHQITCSVDNRYCISFRGLGTQIKDRQTANYVFMFWVILCDIGPTCIRVLRFVNRDIKTVLTYLQRLRPGTSKFRGMVCTSSVIFLDRKKKVAFQFIITTMSRELLASTVIVYYQNCWIQGVTSRRTSILTFAAQFFVSVLPNWQYVFVFLLIQVTERDDWNWIIRHSIKCVT